MTQARRELQAIAELASYLADAWGLYETTEALLGAPTIAAAVGGGGRGSDHADPTAGVVASHAHYHATCDEIREALGHLRATQARMARVVKQHPESAREADAAVKALRCDGTIDPTCTRNAVRDGKCWPCYNTVRRAR